MKNVGKLRRLCVWLGRIGCCRGFGVQSPWAYSFVRYVINEHFPYYKYAALRKKWHALGAAERKVCEFCFRLANYAKLGAVLIVSLSTDDELHNALRAYFKAGRRKCEVGSCEGQELSAALRDAKKNGKVPVAVVVSPSSVEALDLSELANSLSCGDYILIEDLRLHRGAAEKWEQLYGSIGRGALFFDMYYCGLVYIDPERYKVHYKINF